MRANVTPPEGASAHVVRFVGSDDEWDAAVRDLGGGNFCHLAGWRHVLAEALGHESLRLVAQGPGGETLGLLPMARVKSRLFGDYLLSMPFLSYGGPLGSEEAKRALVEAAVAEARTLGVDLLELRARERLPGDLSVSERKLTVLKALPATSEELWEKGIKAKLRSQVRRPQKEGMTARFGLDALPDFYEVFARTMRDLGTPVLARRFFDVIAERFAEESVVGVIEHQGRVVAAGYGFLWGGEVEITWAGALREYSASAPNMLLYWSFMEESIRRGAGTFNFGRCSPGSGTHRFKMQWGAEERVLPWAQWSPGGVASTPSPDSAKFRLATAVWTKLPVPVANLIGPRISRLLP
jgi:FemAB-related protein (PEP-CTERM system-associated)